MPTAPATEHVVPAPERATTRAPLAGSRHGRQPAHAALRMRRVRHARLLGVLLFSAAAGCAAGCAADTASLADAQAELALDDDALEKRALRAQLEAVRAPDQVVGLSAEVWTPEGRERARVGSNDPERSTPLPWGAQFRIASVSKTFTAVVVLQLVQESKLSLSDSVERWLPGVVAGAGNNGAAITVQQLLRHQSGLNNYLEAPALGALLASVEAFQTHRFDTYSQADYVALAMAQAPLFAPGEAFAYSNTNYLLLGMIIEAVTGQRWREQVERRIIAPLRLINTYVPGYGPFLVGPHVRGFASFPGSEQLVDVTDNSLISGADAGLVSNLSDLNRFFQALLRGELLSPALLRAMQDSVVIDNPAFPDGRYGLGLQWSPLSCGGGYWHHTGDTLGYSVWTGVTNDGSRSVAVVANSPVESERAASAATRLIDRALCALPSHE